MSHFRSAQYSILSLLGLASMYCGMFLFENPVLSVSGLILVTITSSSALSKLFSGHLKGTGTILGFLIATSYMMMAGSLIYYLGTVTDFAIFLIIAVLPLFSWVATLRSAVLENAVSQERPGFVDAILVAMVIVALTGFFLTVTGSQSAEPTRSPWLILDPSVLAWIGVSMAGVFLLAKRSQVALAIGGSVATFFALVSVVLIVFPLGYGFDPFLHQATIEHILLNGTITPKPFYYIGQYAIEFVLAFNSNIDVHTIDVFLLPILSALLLPVIASACVWQITKRNVPTALGAIGALIIPLSSYINTTPQGFANLWSLLIFFLALPELITKHRWVPHWVLALMALATILVHPLAGLPVALFLVFTFLIVRDDIPKALKRILLTVVAICGSVMLPVAFAVSGASHSIGFHPENALNLLPTLFFSSRFLVIGDLLAYIGLNAWLWYSLLAIVAGTILWNMTSRRWLILPLVSIVLVVNAVVLSVAGDFSFLIDYEQTNYVGRVMLLSLYVMLPLCVLGFALGIERILQIKKLLVSGAVMILCMIVVSANGYYTYPRQDAYAVSRGFTVGQSDHDTVVSIRSDAKDVPYVVLANQSVSAVAIQDFGFAPYYGDNKDVFYYPVPTGGPLYQIFLRMIEDNPTQELALEAMDLANVDRVYFVVNDYWWSAEVAIERAKVETSEWFSVDDGATTVFVYDRGSDNEQL